MNQLTENRIKIISYLIRCPFESNNCPIRKNIQYNNISELVDKVKLLSNEEVNDILKTHANCKTDHEWI